MKTFSLLLLAAVLAGCASRADREFKEEVARFDARLEGPMCYADLLKGIADVKAKAAAANVRTGSYQDWQKMAGHYISDINWRTQFGEHNPPIDLGPLKRFTDELNKHL